MLKNVCQFPFRRSGLSTQYDTELGDPVDDLSVATVLMVVGGQLVLLRPRKVCLFYISLSYISVTQLH